MIKCVVICDQKKIDIEININDLNWIVGWPIIEEDESQVKTCHSVEFLCKVTFHNLLLTQLHFCIVDRELGNSMGIISRKFRYLAAILQLEKTITGGCWK